jgi:protein gp37
MSLNTGIEWTDATWNPTTGCDRVSPGCDHCYALTLAKRLQAMGNPRYQRDGSSRTSGPGFGLTIHADKLEDPYLWRKPRRVFVNSMSDLFHARVPAGFIYRVFDVMADLPQHHFQILTKRPRRMVAVVNAWYAQTKRLPLPNVWLGASVEDQTWADRRVPLLGQVTAAVRFLSCEPLLGPIRLSHLDALHWVIVGGESGVRARAMEPQWAYEIRDQCVEAGVAFFFKQWGGRTPKAGGRTLEGRTWDEYPLGERKGSGDSHLGLLDTSQA